MKIKNIISILITLLVLSGCVQSTAFMGPGVTIVTSGNVAQAGFQYGTNKLIEQKTGKNTLGLITDTLSENSKEEISKNELNKKQFHEKFKNIVEKRFYKTRNIIKYN